MKTILPFRKIFLALILHLALIQASAQISTEFVFRNPFLISGVADQDGAVYKFKNVAPGIDANVTVVSRSGPNVFLDTIDIPLSNGMGYDKALQPQIGLHGNAPANSSWWLKLKVNFLREGTNKAVEVTNFVASAIDVDGDNLSIAENIKMYKANSVTTSVSSVLSSVLPLTAICPKHKVSGIPINCSSCNGLGYIIKSNGKVQGCGNCDNSGRLFAVCRDPWVGSDIQINGTVFNALGIDTLAVNNMATFSYSNTDEVVFDYGATTGLVASSAGQRLNSLWFKSFNYSISSLLAITQFDFSAINEQNAVALRWLSPQQQTVSKFIVEHSMDGVNFAECGMVSASIASNIYEYTDQIGASILRIYYRLKLVESNGQLSYSAVKLVNRKAEVGPKVTSYPNPAKEHLYFDMPAAWINKKATIYLYNNSGILVKSLRIQNLGATESMNISNLTRGTYLVNIRCNDAQMKSLIVKD